MHFHICPGKQQILVVPYLRLPCELVICEAIQTMKFELGSFLAGQPHYSCFLVGGELLGGTPCNVTIDMRVITTQYQFLGLMVIVATIASPTLIALIV